MSDPQAFVQVEGDGNKAHNKEAKQRLAARNVALFTFHVLAQGGFAPRPEDPTPPTPDSAGPNITVTGNGNIAAGRDMHLGDAAPSQLAKLRDAARRLARDREPPAD